MDHKIICWGDYAIPVPNDAKWLAFDKDGSAWVFQQRPRKAASLWINGGEHFGISERFELSPPEPGPWDTQLYYLD